MDFTEKEQYTIQDLLQVIALLRSPEGCPWDQTQTHQSIRQNFIEETYEAVEAIDTDNIPLLREELGDVLLQILLHAQMEQELGHFTFADICNDLCKKLVFRHPHVFGSTTANNSEQALSVWEQQKKVEKQQHTAAQTLEQVSKALPGLMYTEKVQKRAAKTGFDYPDVTQAFTHLKQEVAELEQTTLTSEDAASYEELGDVLFSAVNVARLLGFEAEKLLTDSTAKFVGRFKAMERLANERGMELPEMHLDELNDLWKKAKIQSFVGGNSNDKSRTD